MMKKYFLFLMFIPTFCFSQKTKTTVKPATGIKAKSTVEKKEDLPATPVKPADGFLIVGNIIGYPDGTPVVLLNGNTGAQETTGQIQKNSFTLTGKVDFPDFKLILINGKQPYITLFIDNSLVNIKAKSDSLEYALVTGSSSHNEFAALNNIVMPIRDLFQEGNQNTVAKNAAAELFDNFINRYPNSYIAPLAIYRHYQLLGDVEKMEQLYNRLNQQVKTGPIGNYVAQQISMAKTMPIIGKQLPDFTLEDSTGKKVSLKSLRGKYVLVDFWASWCRPCRMENPNVVASFHKYKNKNYTVLGVSIDKKKDAWMDAVVTDGLVWTNLLDSQDPSISVGQKFQITSIPQNLLVDPNGILIAKNLRGGALESKLSSIFGN